MIGKQRTMYGIITLYLLSVASFIHCLWNCHTTYCGKKAMSKVKVAEMSRELRGGRMGTCVLGFGYSDYGFIFCSLMCLHFLFSPFVGWSVGRSVCRSVSLITIKIPANAHRSMDRTGAMRIGTYRTAVVKLLHQKDRHKHRQTPNNKDEAG